jgi:hypothetical protein
MGPAVNTDLVSRCGEVLDDLGMRTRSLAQDKEGGVDAGCVEVLEHPRGSQRVGTIVEGERGAARPAGDAPVREEELAGHR